MVTRIEIAHRPQHADPRGEALARQARTFLDIPLKQARVVDVYHVEADLGPGEARRILAEFVNPVLAEGALGRWDGSPFDVAVTVGFKPGVTDSVGKSARVAIEDTLGRSLGSDAAVFTSQVWRLVGVSREQAERLGRELLANPLIQRMRVETAEEWRSTPTDLEVPRVRTHGVPPVETVDLALDDAALVELSRGRLLALSVDEMRAIALEFERAGNDPERSAAGLGPAPTDVELECLAQTWSEHCKHKIFNASIVYREGADEPQMIRSLFGTHIRGTTERIERAIVEREGRSWLVSVFHDNAGVVAFDDRRHLVFKVETHNSPSALDPYGGAMTGIVGVNRDPFGTGLGSDLLVNVWGYCFASPFHDRELPRGLLHPRRIRDGVHAGVIDGGNQSGIPYGRGWELFDERFVGKPLVFCGTVGALPVTVAGRPGEAKAARPGDRIVMTGGRIGADGIHGATFSSAALDESAPVQAVQIGDPITQKRMFDFLLEARDLGLYEAITDNGAGGLSSSVGEMAQGPGGACLDLSLAPLKYEGLAPWEILVSEAQERMTLAVAPGKIEAFLGLARRREVEATVLGEFTERPTLEVRWGSRTVALLPMSFLHGGAPELRLEAQWAPRSFDEPSARDRDVAPAEALTALVGRLNLASGVSKARRYDHEVKGLTAVKPWIGVNRDVAADATVFLAGHDSLAGFVLSEGVNPYFSDLDTHAMAGAAVDLAVRRQLCGGARIDRIAILDNFCWPDPVATKDNPDGPYKLAQLVRACRGLDEAAVAYGTPLISGKDSMKNDSTLGGIRISVPPTLLVSAIGKIDDVRRAVTLEPRATGDRIYCLGLTRAETGGSEYFRYLGDRSGRRAPLGAPAPFVGSAVPRLLTAETVPLYSALAQAVAAGLVRSATALALGGWAVAAAKMAIAGGIGVDLDLDSAAGIDALGVDEALFSESLGRILVTVSPGDATRFERLFDGLACVEAGALDGTGRLRLRRGASIWAECAIESLANAHTGTLRDV